jgi:hypothetical protein
MILRFSSFVPLLLEGFGFEGYDCWKQRPRTPSQLVYKISMAYLPWVILKKYRKAAKLVVQDYLDGTDDSSLLSGWASLEPFPSPLFDP